VKSARCSALMMKLSVVGGTGPQLGMERSERHE
jgi:hypothetical protein